MKRLFKIRALILIVLLMTSCFVPQTTITITPPAQSTGIPGEVVGDPVMSADLTFTFTITAPTMNGFELYWDEACTDPIPVGVPITIGDENGEIQIGSWWSANIYCKNIGGGSILLQSSYTDSEYYGYITSIMPGNTQVAPGEVVYFEVLVQVLNDATPGTAGTATVSIVAT